MKHLGDICKINGAEIEKVDVITFGAPCQDLSVAGKRAGMKHEEMGDDETTRSGLFYEAIRIIKEMREDDIRNGRTDEFVRPRYAVYENVPGALSSNKNEVGSGEDFRCVLEEICKVIQPDVSIPRFEGKWPYSGSIILDNGSIAWTLTDAQYHGVPQRRKRICVLCDFNGFTAPGILFDPQLERTTESGEPYSLVRCLGRGSGCEVQPIEQSVSGHSESCEQEGKEIAGDIGRST